MFSVSLLIGCRSSLSGSAILPLDIAVLKGGHLENSYPEHETLSSQRVCEASWRQTVQPSPVGMNQTQTLPKIASGCTASTCKCRKLMERSPLPDTLEEASTLRCFAAPNLPLNSGASMAEFYMISVRGNSNALRPKDEYCSLLIQASILGNVLLAETTSRYRVEEQLTPCI